LLRTLETEKDIKCCDVMIFIELSFNLMAFLPGVEVVLAYDFSLGASLGKWAALDPSKVLSESDLRQRY